MVEYLFDSIIEYFFPTIASMILQSVDDLQQAQNPPYSKGIYFVQMREKFKTYKLSNRLVYGDFFIEPVYTNMARSDMFYLDKNFSKVSIKKIDETYEKFTESIRRKWPGSGVSP